MKPGVKNTSRHPTDQIQYLGTGYSSVRFVTQCIQPCMAMYDSVHAAMHGDSAPSAISQKSYTAAGWLELISPASFSKAALRNPKLPFRSTASSRGQANFRSQTAGWHGHLHYNIPSTPYIMVYSISEREFFFQLCHHQIHQNNFNNQGTSVESSSKL